MASGFSKQPASRHEFICSRPAQLRPDPALRAQAPQRAKVIVVSSGHNAFNLK
jgi:hypothetical protein